MPGKLKDCQSKDPTTVRDLHGRGRLRRRFRRAGAQPDDAGDPAALRGKILNVEKARLDRALANQEIQSMITAFGAGIR